MLHLKGFHLHFVPKMGSGHIILVSLVTLRTMKTSNMRAFLQCRKIKFVYFVLESSQIKVFRHVKLMTSGEQKQPKLVLEGRSPMRG